MAEKKYFNPTTLSFEEIKPSLKDIFKRILWFIASAVAFSVLILWISFYLFTSPREKMLEKENNELRHALEMVNNRFEVLQIILKDIQERDDEVYRSIFEAPPIPVSERYPFVLSHEHSRLERGNISQYIENMNKKADLLTLQISLQKKSLDTLQQFASMKTEMLSAIPAIRPLKGMHHITSGFGRRYHPILKTLRPHTGIDITAPKGTPVYATGDGIVSNETGGSGYGICVVINHGYSYQTLYAHLSKKIVRPGQKIKRGQIIGYVGSTGLSMGPHLHYEVIKNGVYVNPVHYFYGDISPEEYEQILKSSKEVNQALS